MFWRQAHQQYRGLIARAHWLGGLHNGMSASLYWGAMFMAIYRTADGRLSSQQLTDLIRATMARSLPLKLRMRGSGMFTNRYQTRMRRAAERSHQRRFVGDWVYDFLPGRSTNEFGLNIHECGLCKLATTEGCPEVVPAICQLDFLLAKFAGGRLQRTGTLATGAPYCDFRYFKTPVMPKWE